MYKLADWIKRHQIVSFFVITYAITWGLGFSYGAVLQHGRFMLAPLFFIATCGPALSGIIITAVTSTEPRQGARRAFWFAFLSAWVISAIVFLIHSAFFNHMPISPKMIGFALVSVLPVAFIVSMAFSRIPGVNRYLSSLIRLRGVWGWSTLALVLTPVLILASVPISSILGRQPITAYQFPAAGLALVGLVVVKIFYQLFFFNATGEEVGWRGFALPRLQALTCPLIAALILAFFWASWHYFLWRAQGHLLSDWQFWIEQYLIHILFALYLVWIYNRARGSILVAGIAHAAANTALAFFPRVDFPILGAIWTIVVLILILSDRMWAKLPHDHPAVYKTPASTA
jgi:membrane protease YdiL (CAAX protease family)